MPVSREEAEEYELAGLDDEERELAHSAKPNEDEEDEGDEHARLLTEEGKLSEEVDDFIRTALEEDLVVGKTNIDELIARLGCCCTALTL